MTHDASPIDDDERCLDLALRYREPLAFADYLISTIVALRAHDTPLEAVIDRFARLRDRHPLAGAYVDEALDQLACGSEWNELIIDSTLPTEAAPFLDAMLCGDVEAAARIVRKMSFAGASIERIYLNVLEPSQREVGRLWELGMLSAAHEHAFTSGVARIMHEIGPSLERECASNHVLVAACAEGEQHAIGIEMVADVFRLNDWHVHLLGADAPSDELVDFAIEAGADVLALSVSVLKNLQAVEYVRSALDRRAARKRMRFVVGGRLFNMTPGLWAKTGADGFAPDACSALRIVTGEPLSS